MIREIKTIVENYIKASSLCDYITGTVEEKGIRYFDNNILIPNSMIVGNLKNGIMVGQKVRLLRKSGGSEFLILEIVTE